MENISLLVIALGVFLILLQIYVVIPEKLDKVLYLGTL